MKEDGLNETIWNLTPNPNPKATIKLRHLTYGRKYRRAKILRILRYLNNWTAKMTDKRARTPMIHRTWADTVASSRSAVNVGGTAAKREKKPWWSWIPLVQDTVCVREAEMGVEPCFLWFVSLLVLSYYDDRASGLKPHGAEGTLTSTLIVPLFLLFFQLCLSHAHAWLIKILHCLLALLPSAVLPSLPELSMSV